MAKQIEMHRPLALFCLLLLLLGAELAAAARPKKTRVKKKIPPTNNKDTKHTLADGANSAIMRGYYAGRGRYPWMVDIRHPLDAHWCGGALIHPRVVLTAAHCFLNPDGTRKPTWDPKVRIGQWAQMSEPASVYDARQTIKTLVHPKYDPNDFAGGHDATLLLLDAPSSRSPVKLPKFTPKPKLPVAVNSVLYALGWGANGELGVVGTDILREVSLKLQSLDTCQKFNPPQDYGDFNQNTNLCAGNPPYKEDVCSGDSGGPLFQKGKTAAADVLLGTTSYGLTCETTRAAGEPGVYTDVAALVPWITEAMACLLDPTKCTGRIYGDPQVLGFNNATFTPTDAKPGKMLDLLAAASPQFSLRGQLSYGPRLGTTALSWVGLTWGESTQVYLSKGNLVATVGTKALKAGANAPLKSGSLTVAKQMNGKERRVDIVKPGVTISVVQPYVNKAYADWLDVYVTLTGAPPVGQLSGLLGGTLPSPAAGGSPAGLPAKAAFLGRA